MEGVAAPLGVAPPGVIEGVAPGVSSHLERRLLAEGVGVSLMILSPGCTERGVSAQPAEAGEGGVSPPTPRPTIIESRRYQTHLWCPCRS